MVQRKHVLARSALLSLAVPLALVCLFFAATARASSPWGELGHTFLHEGIGAGQLNIAEPTTVAIDPSDGSVYMADQIATKAHPTYRIQRVNAKGEVEASTTFTPPEEQKTSLGSAGEGVQLAVDPTDGRLYALVVYRRREENTREEQELEKEEKDLEAKSEVCKPPTTCYSRFPQDSGELTTGELYAFEYAGGQLVPAKTEEPSPGVKVAVPIVTDSQFKAQGEHPREALLNPHGVAVEPSSGDVVITGNEDQQEDLNVEKGAAQQCRAAAQFITVSEKAGGELSGAIGNRYVDEREIIQELPCGEKEVDEYVPFSPFVSAGGRLFAEEDRPQCPEPGGKPEECHEGGEIWELPKSSEFLRETGKVKEYATAPRPVFWLSEQQLEGMRFGPEGGAVQPTMSYVAEAPGSTSGKVYLSAEVLGKKGEARVGAVLTLGYDESGATPQFTELGWTGGGHEAVGGQEGCLIPDPNSQAFFLGGFKASGQGAAEGVTVFDIFKFDNKDTIESAQFGPGGSTADCPNATLTKPSVEVNDVPVTKVVPGEAVTFSSTLEAAEPLSVEWKLENTTTHKMETVPGKAEAQITSLAHTFSEEGEYKVTEIVQTDNLADPSVEAQLEHELRVELSRPEFEISAASSIEKGQEASFEAIVADENKQNVPYKYVWQFGDGAREEGETSNSILLAKHTYASLCETCTVTLEVTDKQGAFGKTTRTVDVGKDKAEKEKEKEAEAEAKRIAEEAAKRAAAEAQHKAEEEAAKKHSEEEAAAKRKAEEEAAAKHKAEEEAAAKRKAEEAKAKSTPTRVQLLAKALALCKKQPKGKRAKCEATARKRYGPKSKHKDAKKKK